MKEVIKANFKIGDNNDIAGVMDCGSSSKKFSCWSTGVIDVESHSNVYGKTHDRKDVSLLNCLKTGEEHKLNFKSQESSYSCEIFSHTMIVGNEKIDPAEDKFESISFNVGNPSKLFNNFDSFGYIDAISPNLADALNEQEFTTPFDAERTILGYFNGEFTIFKKTTEIGLISAHCYVSHNADVFSGVKIENKFIITIEFNASITLDEGFKRANLVSSFLRFIAGQGLFFHGFSVSKKGQEFIVNHNSNTWGENLETFRNEPIMDVPSDNFLKVLTNWFQKTDRENVRYIFYNSHFSNIYNYERLITAANMFDIFPREEITGYNPLSDEELDLISELKSFIEEKFTNSPKLNKYLDRAVKSSVQRIKKPERATLLEKINERLAIARPYIVANQLSFQDLELVVRVAKNCRNYHVHGSEPKELNVSQIFEFHPLFIDTLEYIYAVSELIDCGWDYNLRRNNIHFCKLIDYKKRIEFDIKDFKKAVID